MLGQYENFFKEWIPWIFLLCIPSLLHLLSSLDGFWRECRQLPFFRFWQHTGFWLWCLFQLILPSLAFWFMFSIDKKPAIDGFLYIKAGLFGIGFFGFVNATPQIGPVVINIKSYYNVFLKIALAMILKKESGRSAEFWREFENELLNLQIDNIIYGLSFLESYINADATFNKSLKDSEIDKLTEEHLRLLNLAKRKKPRVEQSKAIINIYKQVIRNQDYSKALKAFNCLQTLNHYDKNLRK